MTPKALRRPAGERRRGLLVGALRIGLPLFALAVFASLFVFNGARFNSRISLDGVDPSALEEGLKLVNPRFTGATKRGEPFTVTADWALPDGPDPELVELSGVKGEITLADGRIADLTAQGGALRPKAKTVELEGAVTLVTSDGYRLTAERAMLDANTEALTASGGVVAESPMGRIEAESMRATRVRKPTGAAANGGAEGAPEDENVYISFENRVRVRIDRPGTAPDPG